MSQKHLYKSSCSKTFFSFFFLISIFFRNYLSA